MKKRMGFVSNSSSSSFIIDKKYLTGTQLHKIKNHDAHWEKYGYAKDKDIWNIEETEHFIMGKTTMDNFDMDKLISDSRVAENLVQWNDIWDFSEYDYMEESYEN